MADSEPGLVDQVLMIRATGDDRPGITAALTEPLARHGVRVLDVNQAVIHSTVLLGMLVGIPRSVDGLVILGELQRVADRLDLRLRTRPIDGDEYSAWVDRQGKQRNILTLLARSITARRLHAVAQVIEQQKLNIDVITRLSGRRRLVASPDHPPRACVEISVRGTPVDADAMHEKFMELSRDLDMDVAWQRDDVYRRTRRMVAFDMDSTLIQAEVIDELAKQAGVGEQVSKVTEAAMQGEIDFDESLRRRVALLEGLEESALAAVAQRLELTEGARRLIDNLHTFGYKTAIISGGFTYFGHYLQKKLGIDRVFANELDIQNGKLTGKVIPPIVNGQRKADLLREMAQQENIHLEQVIAVGDGANDLPMLNLAGLGIAFRAKPIVQKTADHKLSTLGLDAILYMIGVRDRDLVAEPDPLSPGRSEPTHSASLTPSPFGRGLG